MKIIEIYYNTNIKIYKINYHQIAIQIDFNNYQIDNLLIDCIENIIII